jgi:Zn ribbon nucleic-acid-binding protein
MTSEPDVAAGWTQAKLCPGCCVLGDIPEYTPSAEIRIPLVECTRCGFRFPILPLGEPRVLTLHAMRNHDCSGEDQGNWL